MYGLGDRRPLVNPTGDGGTLDFAGLGAKVFTFTPGVRRAQVQAFTGCPRLWVRWNAGTIDITGADKTLAADVQINGGDPPAIAPPGKTIGTVCIYAEAAAVFGVDFAVKGCD